MHQLHQQVCPQMLNGYCGLAGLQVVLCGLQFGLGSMVELCTNAATCCCAYLLSKGFGRTE
jgi:hypothetical protein